MRHDHDCSENRSAAVSILRSERGAALVLAMIAVIVMTMLGLLLLEVLRHSFGQVSASEANVQAEAIAQKGLDESVSMIRRAADQINRLSLPEREKSAQLHDLLFTKLQDAVSALNQNAEAARRNGDTRGIYRITILESGDNEAERKDMPDMTPDYPYVARFKIQAAGDIGSGPNHQVTKVTDVYVSTINRVFRYPVSTSGDLTLNGFPSIIGDVVAEGALFYSNKAQFKGQEGASYSLETSFPAIKGFIRAMGGYFDNREQKPIVPSPWQSDYFAKAAVPFEDDTMQPGTPIAIHNESVTDFVNRKVSDLPAITNVWADSGSMTGYSFRNGEVKSGGKIRREWMNVQNDGLTVNGNLQLEGGVLALKDGATLTLNDGSLYISYDNPGLAAADLAGTLRFGTAAGDGGKKSRGAYIDGNVVIRDKFSMNGNMFINGNLKIAGDIHIDGAIYVAGSVELRDMRSINAGDESLPLIIVASKAFDFSGSLQPQQDLHAFLYSEEDVHLYGVTSEIRIRGGIHGKNMTLSGVGKIANQDSPQRFGDQIFNLTPNQTLPEVQEAMKPKLQIVYDNELYDYFLREGIIDRPIAIPTTGKLDVYVKQVTYE